jgi:hypothetical protein
MVKQYANPRDKREIEAGDTVVKSQRKCWDPRDFSAFQQKKEDSSDCLSPFWEQAWEVYTAGAWREASPARADIRWEPLERADLLWPGNRARPPPLPALHPPNPMH